MKKRLFITLLIILQFFLIVILCIKNNDCFEMIYKESDLNNYLSKYTESYKIEIFRVQNQKIYGSVYDAEKNGDLFSTKGLFLYDENTKNFSFYMNDDESRILDYYIINNNFYKLTISYYGDNYKWKLLLNDKEIMSGIIIDFFSYPVLLPKENELYIAFIKNEITQNDINQKFGLSKVFKNKITNTFSLDYKVNEKVGKRVYDISRVFFWNNDFFYTFIDSNNIQYLAKYNLEDNKQLILYENADSKHIIYSYLLNDNFLYYQVTSKNNTDNSIFYIEGKDFKNTKKSKMNTFEKIMGNNILMHNKDNSWKMYDIYNNKVLKVEIKKNDIYPKYFVLNEFEILFVDYDEIVYLGTLVRR